MKKVAITGGLGCGKTTVCRYFKELGAYVVNADEIVHDLLSSNSLIRQAVFRIVDPLGKSDKVLDRKAIGTLVFQDPEKLKALETLLHPEVFQEIENQYKRAKQTRKYPLFIAEIPLLYEANKEDLFDAVICVVASKEVAKKRFLQNKSYSAEDFERRMERQLSTETKAQKADYLLENSGSLALLETDVKKLFLSLCKSES